MLFPETTHSALKVYIFSACMVPGNQTHDLAMWCLTNWLIRTNISEKNICDDISIKIKQAVTHLRSIFQEIWLMNLLNFFLAAMPYDMNEKTRHVCKLILSCSLDN